MDWTWWFLSCLAVWRTATTIATAQIFLPLRKLAQRCCPLLAEGVSCPLCLSHYIALALFVLYQLSETWYTVIVGISSIIAVSSIIARIWEMTTVYLKKGTPCQNQNEPSP